MSFGSDPRERPEFPDPIVLETTSEAVRELGRIGSGALLQVGGRIDRGASTHFKLRWEDSHGGTCSAYYKVLSPPRDRPAWWPDATRASLQRAVLLDQRLAELGADQLVQTARVLAVDPVQFVIVTLATPGAPLSQHLRSFRRRGRGWDLRGVYFGLGQFVRRIESCTLPGEVTPIMARRSFLEATLTQARAVMGDDLNFVERLIDRQFDDAAGTDRFVLSHGDLGPKNILISGNRAGVIDFDWIPALPGHDVSYLATRSEFVLQFPTPFLKGLVRALIAGYGDPGLPSSSGWMLSRVEALMRLIIQQGDQTGIRRMRHWRAVNALRREARRAAAG